MRSADLMRVVDAMVFVCVAAVACEPVDDAPRSDVVSREALSPELDEVELEFVRVLNDYRAEVGAPPLTPIAEINAAADAHSEDMGLRSYFAHEALEPAPYGVQPWDRMCSFEFGPACDLSTPIGENISAGYGDAFSAFTAWRNSPGHDENMRDAMFHSIGVGRSYVEGSLYRWYWTTDFAGETSDCLCVDGQQRSCLTDRCGPGRSTCHDCEFGPCVVPEAGEVEICGDGFDNDCDSEIDEEQDCGPRCEPEPEVCDEADNDCDGLADEEEICDIRCFPLDEVCDGVDNDCDFTVDEGCPCEGRPDNPFCGDDEGLCSTGTQECEFGEEGGRLTECRGAISPSLEICDGFDNDCDGMTDEGDACESTDDGSDTGCSCRASGFGGRRATRFPSFSYPMQLLR